MVPLQLDASPEIWIVLLLFVVVSVPVFIGAVAFINRATEDGRDEELQELRRRVEELESKQE